MIWRVMRAVYELLGSAGIADLKTIYAPGRPAGPFAGNIPAAVIVTGNPGERREYIATDATDFTLRVEVHVFTRDPLDRTEQRRRGSYEQLLSVLDDIATTLEASPELGGLVDGLEGLEIEDTGPGHGLVRATYSIRKGG